MKRVMVIGCPGSGKSTLARKLQQITGLPLVYLDMLYWNSDKTTVSREVFLQRLKEAAEKEEWIIDGNYQSSLSVRLERCDTVIFLDFPAAVCLEGIEKRRGKPRADIPWVETEEDEEFLTFIREFSEKSRPKILLLRERFCQKSWVVLQNRQQAEEYLSSLMAKEKSR